MGPSTQSPTPNTMQRRESKSGLDPRAKEFTPVTSTVTVAPSIDILPFNPMMNFPLTVFGGLAASQQLPLGNAFIPRPNSAVPPPPPPPGTSEDAPAEQSVKLATAASVAPPSTTDAPVVGRQRIKLHNKAAAVQPSSVTAMKDEEKSDTTQKADPKTSSFDSNIKNDGKPDFNKPLDSNNSFTSTTNNNNLMNGKSPRTGLTPQSALAAPFCPQIPDFSSALKLLAANTGAAQFTPEMMNQLLAEKPESLATLHPAGVFPLFDRGFYPFLPNILPALPTGSIVPPPIASAANNTNNSFLPPQNNKNITTAEKDHQQQQQQKQTIPTDSTSVIPNNDSSYSSSNKRPSVPGEHLNKQQANLPQGASSNPSSPPKRNVISSMLTPVPVVVDSKARLQQQAAAATTTVQTNTTSSNINNNNSVNTSQPGSSSAAVPSAAVNPTTTTSNINDTNSSTVVPLSSNAKQAKDALNAAPLNVSTAVTNPTTSNPANIPSGTSNAAATVTTAIGSSGVAAASKPAPRILMPQVPSSSQQQQAAPSASAAPAVQSQQPSRSQQQQLYQQQQQQLYQQQLEEKKRSRYDNLPRFVEIFGALPHCRRTSKGPSAGILPRQLILNRMTIAAVQSPVDRACAALASLSSPRGSTAVASSLTHPNVAAVLPQKTTSSGQQQQRLPTASSTNNTTATTTNIVPSIPTIRGAFELPPSNSPRNQQKLLPATEAVLLDDSENEGPPGVAPVSSSTSAVRPSVILMKSAPSDVKKSKDQIDDDDAPPPGVSLVNQLDRFLIANMQARTNTSPAIAPGAAPGGGTDDWDDNSDAPPGLVTQATPLVSGGGRASTMSPQSSRVFSRMDLLGVYCSMVRLTKNRSLASTISCVPRNPLGRGQPPTPTLGMSYMASGRQTPVPSQPNARFPFNANRGMMGGKDVNRSLFGSKVSNAQRSKIGKDKEPLHREIMALLNKLTVEKFERVADQIASVCEKISTPEHLRLMVELIFDKAISEPGFDFLNADLCTVLAARSPVFEIISEEGTKTMVVTFKRQFVNTIQDAFERFVPDTFEIPEDEKEGLTEADMEVKLVTMKKKMLGTMNFIGHMLLRRLINPKVITEIVPSMISNPESPIPSGNKVEACCELIRQVGRFIESWDPKALDSWMDRLKELSVLMKDNLKVYFCILNLIELRDGEWLEVVRGDKASTLKDVEKRHYRETNQRGGQLAAFTKGELTAVGELQTQPYQGFIEKHAQLLAKIIQKELAVKTIQVSAASFNMGGKTPEPSPSMAPQENPEHIDDDDNDDDGDDLTNEGEGEDENIDDLASNTSSEKDLNDFEKDVTVEEEQEQEKTEPLWTAVLKPDEDALSVQLMPALSSLYSSLINNDTISLSDEQIATWADFWVDKLSIDAPDAEIRHTRQLIALLRMGSDISGKKNQSRNLSELIIHLVHQKIVILPSLYKALAVWLAGSQSIDAPKASRWIRNLAMQVFGCTCAKNEGLPTESCSIEVGIRPDENFMVGIADRTPEYQVIISFLNVAEFGIARVLAIIARLCYEAVSWIKLPKDNNSGRTAIRELESFLRASAAKEGDEMLAHAEESIETAFNTIRHAVEGRSIFEIDDWDNTVCSKKSSFSSLWSQIRCLDDVLDGLNLTESDLDFSEDLDTVLVSIIGLAFNEMDRKSHQSHNITPSESSRTPNEEDDIKSRLSAEESLSKRIISTVAPLIENALNVTDLGPISGKLRLEIAVTLLAWYYNLRPSIAISTCELIKTDSVPAVVVTENMTDNSTTNGSIINLSALVTKKV